MSTSADSGISARNGNAEEPVNEHPGEVGKQRVDGSAVELEISDNQTSFGAL